MHFACQKHYFLLLQNIERTCFTTLNASINDAFKVSTNPAIRGWHAGMAVQDILNQLSSIYGLPTLAAMDLNEITFRSLYLAADAPELLFCWIKDCANIAILGRNLYTDCQLINNAIRFLLTTSIYVQMFEEWDHLHLNAQTWVALCTMIQDVFQHRLNATAPTAGHHGYAPAWPFQQNVFGALGEDKDNDNKELIVESVVNQVATLTYQSQLTASTAATMTQQSEQQFAAIAADHFITTLLARSHLCYSKATCVFLWCTILIPMRF
jgi:hypothetical protein